MQIHGCDDRYSLQKKKIVAICNELFQCIWKAIRIKLRFRQQTSSIVNCSSNI